MVDSNGRHGLASKKEKGGHMSYEEVNKLIKRGLDQAKITSILEPIGLSRATQGWARIFWKKKLLHFQNHFKGSTFKQNSEN